MYNGGGGSDNAPLRGGKGQMFEGGIRVPFMAQWKGKLPQGRVSDAVISSLDIAPTAYLNKANSPWPKGATGFGVRLLVEMLRGWE